MSEKCLLITSLAILVCHPSSTIRCFKPKPSSTNSPKKEKNQLEDKVISKSRKGLVFNSCTCCGSPRFNVHRPFKLLDEISEGNPLKTIVEDIFRFEWKREVGYKIEKILKVNHTEKVIENFEECKKISMNTSKKGVERVFYHGAMITCSLGLDKSTRICNKKTCGVCKIIVKNCRLIHEETNWIELFSTSCWSAHRKIIKQFGDGVSKKAIIISRVIAKCKEDNKGEVNILNPKAILPCFVIIYSLS